MMKQLVCISLFMIASLTLAAPLVYEGDAGVGKGTHIVLLAGDQEYRAEETLTALARILAKHHGFKCTVLFAQDANGTINPGKNHIPGMEVLKDADLMVNFLRFRTLPDAQMQPFEDYLLRGGAVLGLRTSSHAFGSKKVEADAAGWGRFHFKTEQPGFEGGFGRQVLGDTWQAHHGQNRVMSTRIEIEPEFKSHPVMRGVETPWAIEGSYWQEPMANCQIMAYARPLVGMKKDSEYAPDFDPSPAFWMRDYQWGNGKPGKAAYLAYGSSLSFQGECFRRLIVNACFALSGHEADIRADLNIDLVGEFRPLPFHAGGHRRGVTPDMLQDWDSPILPGAEPPAPKPRIKKKKPHTTKAH